MLKSAFVNFWSDEQGSVLATEYLMLGSIVSLGTVTGLQNMRDAVNSEYKEMGLAVRNVRQSYSYSGLSTPLASVSGGAAQDQGHAAPVATTIAPGMTTVSP